MSKLRENIDRILGNSIRCLLPSYWWKRIFGLVVDEVDKAKNSISTLEDGYKALEDGYKALEESKADADAFIMVETTELDRMEYGAVYLVRGLRDSLKVNFWEYKSPRPDVLNWTIWFSNKTSLEVTSNGVAFQWEGGTPTIDLSNLNPNNLYRLDCTLVTVGASGTTVKYEKRVARIVEYGDSNKYDTFVSETSTNAVQNKVVTEALNNKVDKVEGKQLSTEDFTTALKTKLEGLNVFDPTEINNKVDGLQTQLNTLVSGDASTAIESFNEITAFLNGVTDSETLDGIIAGIEQQIAAKQEQLVSGTNIKTINGQSLLGEGDIEIKADIDTTTLATKEELSALQNEVIANEKVTAAALNDLNDRKADKEFVADAIALAITTTLNTAV